MKVISLVLGDEEIARVEEGVFKDLREQRSEFVPSLRQWYEDCFYGIPNSTTFEERFQLAHDNKYFCFSKPALMLVARTI